MRVEDKSILNQSSGPNEIEELMNYYQSLKAELHSLSLQLSHDKDPDSRAHLVKEIQSIASEMTNLANDLATLGVHNL